MPEWGRCSGPRPSVDRTGYGHLHRPAVVDPDVMTDFIDELMARTAARGWVGAATLWEVIDRRAEATPEAVLAHEDTGAELTFAQYRQACLRAAAGLFADHGVGRDTGVSWELPTWNESLVLVGALARLGARQNPLIPIYRGREVWIHHRAEPRQSAHRAHRLPGLRLRGHGRGHRRTAPGPRGAGGRPPTARRRPVRAAGPGAPAGDGGRGPHPLAVLHLGDHRRPQGSAPHRSHRDGLGAGHGRMSRYPGRRRVRPDLPVHPHRGNRVADGRAVHRLHPVDHRGVRPRQPRPGSWLPTTSPWPARARRSTWPTWPPSGPARDRRSSRTSVPIRVVARPSRRSSTTT